MNLIGYITRRLSADSLRQDSFSRDCIRDPPSNLNQTSPQCRWLAVDIYRAANWLGKYPPLTTSTSVNIVNSNSERCLCLLWKPNAPIYIVTKSDGIPSASGEQENEECRPLDSGEFLAFFSPLYDASVFSKLRTNCREEPRVSWKTPTETWPNYFLELLTNNQRTLEC